MGESPSSLGGVGDRRRRALDIYGSDLGINSVAKKSRTAGIGDYRPSSWALDRRAFAETQVLAKRLQKQGTFAVEELGGAAFALGATAAYEAEDAQGKDRNKLFLLAARYLEEANNRGFPAQRGAEGLYLLGKSLAETGQLTASRSVLLSALKSSPQYRAEIHALLANVYLQESSPQLEQALQQNSLYLAEEKLSHEQRQRGLLQRAQILLRLGKIEECNATLDQIPADAKNYFSAVVERGQVLIYEAHALLKKTPVTEADQARRGKNFR